MLVGALSKCAICGMVIVGERMIASRRTVHPKCVADAPAVVIASQPHHPLLRVGYFRELTRKPRNPELRSAVRPAGDEHEAELIAYLRTGLVVVPGTMQVHDPIAAGGGVIGAGAIMTDGTWDWPDYLPTLVERYHVRMPEEFLVHLGRARAT